MQCKHHPNRKAEHFCRSCNAPLCTDCAEEVRPGEYRCFQCAMLHSVSEVGTSLVEKQAKAGKKKAKAKRKWGPFHGFMIVSGVLILVMWGVILFGGQPAPKRTAEYAKKGRVFLFMVNGALKRYAHYEGNKYPNQLLDLVPKYLDLRDAEIMNLKKITYVPDPDTGYRLSLAEPQRGEMNLVLTSKGVLYGPSSSGGG